MTTSTTSKIRANGTNGGGQMPSQGLLGTPSRRAKQAMEKVIKGILIASSTVAILSTVGIIASLLFESLRFFGEIPLTDFLFGTHWSPQTAIREDQVGASGSFGAIPLFAGTLLISAIAMFVAAPLGLFAAIYLAEYAHATVRNWVKPILEILAGIPTVVYGF
ncbi:MAG: hypothetical protein JKY27_05660, partial [Magnetovibrio sp.]|nr:hypothetical protein [Magnetovibrio sp.]